MLPERILRKMLVLEDGCWEWLGTPHNAGYGTARLDGRNQLIHRITYTAYVGPIPEGLQIDHLCRNRACCNPAHLEAVTSAENTRRGINANAIKTHCPYGHPYAGYNLIETAVGGRACRECHRTQNRERMRAKRARERAARLAAAQ